MRVVLHANGNVRSHTRLYVKRRDIINGNNKHVYMYIYIYVTSTALNYIIIKTGFDCVVRHVRSEGKRREIRKGTANVCLLYRYTLWTVLYLLCGRYLEFLDELTPYFHGLDIKSLLCSPLPSIRLFFVPICSFFFLPSYKSNEVCSTKANVNYYYYYFFIPSVPRFICV